MGDGRELPKYKCHKIVHAVKIKAIVAPDTNPNQESDGSRQIIPDEPGCGPIDVDRAYMLKHDPQPGGYYVVYEDGYRSWSPAGAFEAGYTRVN